MAESYDKGTRRSGSDNQSTSPKRRGGQKPAKPWYEQLLLTLLTVVKRRNPKRYFTLLIIMSDGLQSLLHFLLSSIKHPSLSKEAYKLAISQSSHRKVESECFERHQNVTFENSNPLWNLLTQGNLELTSLLSIETNILLLIGLWQFECLQSRQIQSGGRELHNDLREGNHHEKSYDPALERRGRPRPCGIRPASRPDRIGGNCFDYHHRKFREQNI